MDKLSEISKWDVLNVYNKVKNVVMNYTELEIKVHEATGPEPWGASSTLMREIADATHNRKNCDEIMPAIYMRFNDTDPSNWRQVYKALQLLEFLIKNGSENVVDEVRGHITIVKMLKNFHHVDANGKDQGINVRHRSKELVDLVQNSERLREERKKAKDNRDKYGGYAGGSSQYGGFGSTGGASSSSSRPSQGRYGGFGSSSAGRSGGSKYAGFGSDQFMSTSSRYDDRSDSGSSGANYRDDSDGRRTATPATSSNAESGRNSRQKSPAVSKPAPTQPVVADLFSFDDDDGDNVSTSFAAQPLSPAPSAGGSKPGSDLLTSFALPGPSTASAPPKPAAVPSANALDDDWGDFQGGSSASASVARPLQAAPLASNSGATKSTNTMVDLMGGDDLGLGFQPLPVSPAANTQAPKYNTSAAFQQPLSPTSASNTPGKKETAAKPAATGAFSDIWDMSSELLSMDSLSISKKSGSSAQNQKQSSKVPMNKLAASNQQNSLI